jgi:purine-nucleoside phosphorylase
MIAAVSGPPAEFEEGTVAIVSGSGLGIAPDGCDVLQTVPYERLGWPAGAVAGHAGVLMIGRQRCDDPHEAPGRPMVVLACGRAHRYEGWPEAALRRCVDDLVAWGIRRLVLTNAAGGLGADLAPGSALIVDEVIDMQETPRSGEQPPRLPATTPALAVPAQRAVERFLPARKGRYAAVAGPQYETPAEAAWLATCVDAVGMSTAPEVRAARESGVDLVVISLIVNRSGAPAGHDEVLAAGERSAGALRLALAELMRECWPAGFDTEQSHPV